MRALSKFLTLALVILGAVQIAIASERREHVAAFFQGQTFKTGGSVPVNTVAPVISPTTGFTGTLVSGTNGTWTGSPTFTYQWEYFDTTTNISGATSSSYTPVSGDIGHTLALLVTGTNAFGNATATSNVTSTVAAPTFVGFLDTFTGLTPTWGWSAFKLTSAFGGNWGTVQRQSDNATQVIAFLSTGKADTATFTSFCAGTNCSATTLVDQVSSVNATQATFANMPRVIVDANSNLAVCPLAGTTMKTTFSSTVNTVKQHLFTVVKAGFDDSRWNQSDLPTVSITGNITATSLNVTSMSSQVGISVANNQPHSAAATGIVDSQNVIQNSPIVNTRWQTNISALPTGTTGTLTVSNPGNTNSYPSASKTADGLTITNPVLGGAWLINGPASANFAASAYWGVGLGINSALSSGDWMVTKNATGQNFQAVIGEGMRGAWSVYDYDTFTGVLNYNGVTFGAVPSGPTGNITYSTNVGMTLFGDASASEVASNNCFETMVLFPATEASRVTMAQFLMGQDSISFPFAPTTPDGFTWAGLYQPNDTGAPNTVYGQRTYGPDTYGITWQSEVGGYTWPSGAFATNINNGGTLWHFIVEQGDSDEVETNAERAETSDATTTGSGHDFSWVEYITFKQFPNEAGDWCYTNQIHYDAGGGGVPDIVVLDCHGGQVQVVLNCCLAGSTPASQTCGAAFTPTVGVRYAIIGTGHWTGTGSDTISVNIGPAGTTPIPNVCTASGTLWANSSTAYLKQGFYRGFPWTNVGTLEEYVDNTQWNPTTANAFSAQITTPLPFPTHP